MSHASTNTVARANADRGDSMERVDFDLHGIVGVRLLDATPRDAETVASQLGLPRGRLDRRPEITIRFVAESSVAGPLRLIGVDEAAFDDGGFLILRGPRKSPVAVRIPFEQIGGPNCEIVCRRGAPGIPLLIPIINAGALSRGYLPLHASAFEWQGRGVVVTGWSKGGKTETLLAFASRGARYVGDEWVYLDPHRGRAWGIPEPVTLWRWHLAQLPHVRRRIGWKRRLRLGLFAAVARAAERAVQSRLAAKVLPVDLLRRSLPALQRQLCVNVAPEQLFDTGPPALDPRPSTLDHHAMPVDRIVFTGSHADEGIAVRPIAGSAVAERMAFSLAEERLPLMSSYRRFRFAFPRRANSFLDRIDEVERALLQQALGGRDALELLHPYPVSIPALFDCLAPHLEDEFESSASPQAAPLPTARAVCLTS
ncbi:MAG: hypothetical protein KY476_14210 [Planctomycetes bacterium]|nr:hypothetical protein [Planctomycetota bacterium]